MENVNFQPSGEEIERALMDLGPLLGVTIKEEAPDDLPDPSGAQATTNNVGSISEVGGAIAEGSSNAEGGDSGENAESKGTADSLASPSAGRIQLTTMRCVLCQSLLSATEGTPKLMECLHSACEPCIKAKIEEKQASSRDFLGAERVTIMCPACRLQCQPANMIDQRFVLEKMALEHQGTNGVSSGEQQCNSCDDTEPATSYCVDCAEFICDNCVQAHQRLKITKDHTIKSKEEAVAELQAAQSSTVNAHDMFCSEHVQERLSLFCETCDRLTCRDCQLQRHRDHKYQFTKEMAAQARVAISSLMSEVSYKRVLLGSAMKVIRDRQQLIADKKKALVHEITQTVVKLTNAINTRGKQLVLRLNEVCDAKQKTLSEKKEALEQLAAITDHCVEFVNAALEQGSDTALLYAKHCVCAHLQRIKSRRADIPNPEIPVRISLALDKLPDLVRVLSSIGAIVVDGKVDGGSGGAQGPYHPPAPTPPAPHAALAPHAPHATHGTHAAPANQQQQQSHSAVVALQHVAMHQSYVQTVSSVGGGGSVGVGAVGAVGGLGGVGGVGGAGASSALAPYLSLQHGMRPRSHTPLRHAHVTSTTHPHHLHGVNEMNLRGLLNAQAQAQAGARGSAPSAGAPSPRGPHPAQTAMQHAYQQMMGAYASNAYAAAAAASGRRSGGPRTPSPSPHAQMQHPHAHAHQHQQPPQYPHQHQQHQHQQLHQQQQQSHAKWHIPQHSLVNGGFESCAGASSGSSSGGGVSGGGALSGGGAEFKITLGRPHSQGQAPPLGRQHSGPSIVTSTNPKTPSPSLNGAVSCELDKVCAESVQDLMATIAKLDSNGVQVVAEQAGQPPAGHAHHSHSPPGHAHGGATPSPAPHVHSSTDTDVLHGKGAGVAVVVSGGVSVAGGVAGGGASDPNEDWCAVCMDGGELMCCDKCPKVFHQYCHIPTIEKLPDETETWQCLLCVNFAELGLCGDEGLGLGADGDGGGGGGGGGLPPLAQKVVERITLELYCQYELSLAFREPVPPENHHYHSKIVRPMCLDMIRMKLQPRSPLRYADVSHFVHDCRLLFRNAYAYNLPESQIYKDAKRLEEFFDAQLLKWLPEYAYWSGEGEPPTKRQRNH